MRLKAFEAYGFKSFADRIEIGFEDGITAIVGPNGSGKSNISDAIRWVLGEQSAKYLRGNKMEDVIFSGTSQRRSLGMAEVTLVFDNSEHKVPLDFDEISICRRVYRSGDSEYYLNKKPCRLKDIVDLLADTGLGKGSMSIVGQNKIDEILNSRPEDRRALFEEAAGIAKYRLRKKEAAQRLDETANNITRIYDIMSEIEGRLEPLRLSAERTQKYRQLSVALRNCHISQFIRKVENIEEISGKLLAKIEELNVQHQALTVELTLKENAGFQLKAALDKVNESFSSLQSSISEHENLLEKLHGKDAVLGERVTQSQKALIRLTAQKDKLLQQLCENEANLKSVSEKFDALELERQVAQKAVNSLLSEIESQEHRIAASEEKIADYKSNVFESMQKIVDFRNRIRTCEQEQESRQRKRENLKQEIALVEVTGLELAKTQKALAQEKQLLTDNQELVEEQLRKLKAEQEAAKNKFDNLCDRRNVLNGKLSSLQTRAALLQNMQKEHEGFGRAVKDLLNASAPWRQGLIGVVADLFQVKAALVLAIETALGGTLQHVVTRDEATARDAIEFLKRTQSGRATFLPLDALRPHPLRNEEMEALKLPGIIGIGADLIDCGKELQKVAAFLLGRVVVAEDMDAALLAAKKTNYRLRIVTLTGELLNPGGSITGGSYRQKESGLLSRKNEIRLALKTIESTTNEIVGVQEEIEACEQLMKLAGSKHEEFSFLLQKHQIRRAEVVAYLERTAAETKQNVERAELLEQEKKQYADEYLAARELLAKIRPELAALEDSDRESKEIMDNLQQNLLSDQKTLNSLRTRCQNASITLESTKERAKLIAERIRQVDADVSRIQGEVAGCEEEYEKMEETIAASIKEKEDLAQRQKEVLKAIAADAGGKEKFNEQRMTIIEKTALVENELDRIKKEQILIQQKQHLAELEKVKQQTEYESAIEQMAKNYGIKLEEAKRSLPNSSESDVSLRKTEGVLTKSIEELGPINAGAVEEYEAADARFKFLQAQYNDLSQAKQNLEEVIADINSNMAKKFREALTKINTYFEETYKSLFGGGVARLELQNQTNVLDSGIEIVVQPPGKKLQSLFLLSGGERALTVIALLFALLAYKPAPFCILDEIDAALDEANIERFAVFLSDYAKKTQFIIITHRKGVMEAANILHGITMEESGVTRLLSVKLEERGTQ